MGNPRGRPKKPLDEILAERSEIRLTLAEKIAFEEAARLSGLTLSEWMRQRLKAVAGRELGKKSG